MTKRIALTLVFAFIACRFSARAAEPEILLPGDVPLQIDRPALDQAGLKFEWRLHLPLALTERITSLQLLDEYIYAVSDRGTLFAVRADSGILQWQTPVAQPGDVLFPLAHEAATDHLGDVLVTLANGLLRLDRNTGRQQQRYQFNAPPSAPVAANAEQIIVPQINQRLAAYRLKDGVPLWQYMIDTYISAQPGLIEDHVIFITDSGHAESLDAVQRKAAWKIDLSTRPLLPVFVDDHDIFLTGIDHYLYSIETLTGSRPAGYRWRFRLNGRPLDGPSVTPTTIYQYDPSDGLIALDRASGEPRWTLADMRRRLAGDDRHDFLLDTSAQLVVADRTHGKVLHRVPARGVTFPLANTRNDAILLGSGIGELLCLRPAAAKPLALSDFVSVPSETASTKPASATPAAESTSKKPEQIGLTAQDDPLRADKP